MFKHHCQNAEAININELGQLGRRKEERKERKGRKEERKEEYKKLRGSHRKRARNIKTLQEKGNVFGGSSRDWEVKIKKVKKGHSLAFLLLYHHL